MDIPSKFTVRCRRPLEIWIPLPLNIDIAMNHGKVCVLSTMYSDIADSAIHCDYRHVIYRKTAPVTDITQHLSNVTIYRTTTHWLTQWLNSIRTANKSAGKFEQVIYWSLPDFAKSKQNGVESRIVLLDLCRSEGHAYIIYHHVEWCWCCLCLIFVRDLTGLYWWKKFTKRVLARCWAGRSMRSSSEFSI